MISKTNPRSLPSKSGKTRHTLGVCFPWRAGCDKTTNTYVIDIACAFRKQARSREVANT
jgi:hypothetical protein